MKPTLPIIALVAAMPAFAQETRSLGAHEHGVGALNIAIDGALVAMEFRAPGADIVGFEYAAESDADRAAITAAIGLLRAPLDLFVLPAAAGCIVTEADADLEGGMADDDHDDHDHDHDHEDDGHDDHSDEDHEAGHTEFHATYLLTCDDPEALSGISFAYFETFPNAREVEVQLITSSGAQAFEVERASPTLEFGP